MWKRNASDVTILFFYLHGLGERQWFDSFQSGHGPLGQELYEKFIKGPKTMNQMNHRFKFFFIQNIGSKA